MSSSTTASVCLRPPLEVHAARCSTYWHQDGRKVVLTAGLFLIPARPHSATHQNTLPYTTTSPRAGKWQATIQPPFSFGALCPVCFLVLWLFCWSLIRWFVVVYLLFVHFFFFIELLVVSASSLFLSFSFLFASLWSKLVLVLSLLLMFFLPLSLSS